MKLTKRDVCMCIDGIAIGTLVGGGVVVHKYTLVPMK